MEFVAAELRNRARYARIIQIIQQHSIWPCFIRTLTRYSEPGQPRPHTEQTAHVRKIRPTCRTDGSRSSKARHLTANTPNHVPTKAHASRPSQGISQNADHLAHNSPFPTLVAEVVCTLGDSTLAPDSTRRKWAYRTCRVAGVRASYALGCPSCSL